VVSGKAVTFKEQQTQLDPAGLTREQSNKSAILTSNYNSSAAVRTNSPMFAQYVQTNNSHFKQKPRQTVKQNLVEPASDKVSFSTAAASVIKNQ